MSNIASKPQVYATAKMENNENGITMDFVYHFDTIGSKEFDALISVGLETATWQRLQVPLFNCLAPAQDFLGFINAPMQHSRIHVVNVTFFFLKAKKLVVTFIFRSFLDRENFSVNLL